MGVFAAALYEGVQSADAALGKLGHINQVITKNQEFSVQSERMLASRRGYALTGDKESRDDYDASKAAASDLIAELNTLMKDDASQVSRLNELQHYFLDFSGKLDALQPAFSLPRRPVEGEKPQARVQKPVNTATGTIQSVSDNLIRVGRDIVTREQSRLVQGGKDLGRAQRRVRAVVISGGVFLLAVLAFACVLVARSRGGNDAAAGASGETQDLFRLALEGAGDGVFEWDLATDGAVYSRAFWSMLGYADDKSADTIQAYRDLLHPEDRARVLAHVEKYLSGEISECLVVFRMKHKSGRWAWINARARALYDDTGKPIRLAGAHTDISHIKAYEEKLQKAKEHAESASRAKTDFLAHMSHEIRTPLTAISGIAEIFEAGQARMDEKHRLLVRTLVSSTSSLKDLVNDILDFSKIESEELELEESLFGLQELFDQVISIFSQRAAERGIDFTFDSDAVRRLKFKGDRARLRQILINLIGNALKFTHKGSVAVEAVQSEREGRPFLRISVRDTGIGIDARHFKLIFERFKQADSSVSRKYGGTGLGLPISLRLAKLMGGDIALESELGKGSVFTLSVPMQTQEEQAVNADAENIDDGLEEDARERTLENKSLLLVEDYEGNVVMLSYLLDGLACKYDVARTGLEALNMWKDKSYDLILMDIQMPEMDGFTATAQIRRMEKEKGLLHTPIIGMTAHALVGDREKCIEAGMDTYLAKPIVESELKAKIAEYLLKQKRAA